MALPHARSALFAAGLVLLATCAHSATCPPPNFDTVRDFSLSRYIERPWYSIEQAPNSYQPRDALYCVRAEYRRSPSDASRLLVFNQAKRGSVTGPPQSGSSFLLNAVVKDEARGRLAVGPSFLPSSAYGPYWVIAAGPLNATDPGFAGYEWAVISGGPPTEQGTNGTCTNSRVGTPGVGGGEGLWLFSREPTPSEDVFKKLQGIAAAKGFDLSVLVRVQQAGCSYQPFPTSAGSASVPSLFSG